MFKGTCGNNEMQNTGCGRENNCLYIVIITRGLGMPLNGLAKDEGLASKTVFKKC